MKPILIIAVCAALLVGCAPDDGGAPPSASPTVEDSATPTPTPTEEPAPLVKPALSELVLSPEGLGPVVIGQPVPPAAPAVAIVSWTDDFCGTGDSYANWQPNYDLTTDGGHWPFLTEVTYQDGTTSSPVQHISVQSTEIHTKDGLGIGSTLAQVQSAYGASLDQAPGEYYTAYSVAGSAGQLVFWFDNNDPGVVAYMEVLLGFGQPDFSFSLTGCG